MIAILIFYSLLSCIVIAAMLRPFQTSLAKGPVSDDRLINYLEIIYFITNSFVAVFAIFAAIFARNQFLQAREQTRQMIEQTKQTENARLATIYMELSNRWDNPEFAQMRKIVISMVNYYRGLGVPSDRIGLRIHDYLEGKAELPPDVMPGITREQAYASSAMICSFLEDVGLLCRLGYVRKNDVFDMIGDSIEYFIKYLAPQMIHERRSADNRSIYANVIYLHEQISGFAYYKRDGYGA